MKVAVISDIHGNLPALEAALDDIDRRGVRRIICLGDIIGKGPSSKETVELCQKRCETVLKGNWEDVLYEAYLALGRGDAGVNGRTRWYIDDAGPENVEYLGSLPHSAELKLGGRLIRLFHAHPRDFSRYYAESPVSQRLELFEPGAGDEGGRPADVAVYGDIHGAYMQTVKKKYILLNAGSVGNPLDLPQASYIVLEGDADGEDGAGGGFAAQFVRLPYDIERAVSIARARKPPDLDGYIVELRTGKYFNRA